MSKFYKSGPFIKGCIYTGVFVVSLASTFFIAKGLDNGTKKNKQNEYNRPINTLTMTPGDRLLNSLMGYEAVNIDGGINVLLEDNTLIDIGLVGQGTFSDLEDINIQADLNLNLDGTRISGQLGYYTDTLTFEVDDLCAFRLKTDDLLAFMDMLPTYGIALELPSSLTDLTVDDLTEIIASISEEDKATTPKGDYYYKLDFGSGEEAIQLCVLTDKEDNFKGIRVETFYYQGSKFSIDVKLDGITMEEFHIVNPLLDLTTANKYQDFKPIFTLFDGLYNLQQTKQIGVDMSISLEKQDEENLSYVSLLDGQININADLNENAYSVSANILENSRLHQLDVTYLNETIYASFHNVNVSIQKQTVSSLLQFVLKQLGDDTIDSLFDKLETSMQDIDIGQISQKIKNSLKEINVSEGNINLRIDLSEFGLDHATPIVLGVNFSENGISSIYVNRSEINELAFSFQLDFVEFKTPTLKNVVYTEIEPALPLLEAVINLLSQDEFRLELIATIDNKDTTKGDISIDGGVQFYLDKERNEQSNRGFGYGEINIIDGNQYHHNIKADMRSVEEILFSYNNTLNGKFNIQTLKDMMGLAKDIITNPDDHFIELFGELIDKLTNSPLALALAGDYGLLFEYDIISNLSISDTKVAFDVSFAVFDMPDTHAHLEINYEVGINEEAILKGISLSEIDLGDAVISADISLKDFDHSLDSYRLDPSETYLDFSDIKVLLELGVSTSKFNYFHFTATAHASLEIIGFDLFNLDVPMDIKIRNDHGNVQVAAELLDIPIPLLGAINGNEDYYYAKNRKASLYYQDDTFYIYRRENVGKHIYNVTAPSLYEIVEVLDTDYFLDNILEILLHDMIGLKNSIMNQVNKSISAGEDKIIHYEKVLTDFQYNKTSNYFYFGLDLNELAKTDVFTAATLKVYASNDKNMLTGLSVNVGLSVGIKINLSVDLNFEDDYSAILDATNELVAMNNFVALHQNDARNIKIESCN